MLLKKLMERYPELVKAKVGRITALAQLGRKEEALQLARDANHASRRSEHRVNACQHARPSGALGRGGYILQAGGGRTPWVSHLRIRGVLSLSRVAGKGAEALALAEQYRSAHPTDRMIAGYIEAHVLDHE